MTLPIRTAFVGVGLGLGLALWLVHPPVNVAGQSRDQQAASDLMRASREVVRTASTDAHRFETEHLVLFIDKGLLSTEAERQFSTDVERGLVAAAEFVHRRFEPATRGVRKPTYYLTNRAGISHARATQIFLNARRVIPAPAIAIHESVHLLLIRNPSAPRNRDDLPHDEDARLMATSGVWLAEGFASYAADELAARVHLPPPHLFFNGDNSTVDQEARRWLSESRGAKVVPFVGSHGVPDDLLADRPNVAAPFYVLGQSFIKFMVERAGLAATVQLYEEHFDGTRSIEEDVKRVTGTDLAQWRQEWLRMLAELP
jgi:hypothetical protein